MASLMLREHELDADFFALDASVGPLGIENGYSEDRSERNSVYYLQKAASPSQFARHPKYKGAKRQNDRWYGGFHAIISEVTKSSGDGAVDQVTPNTRLRRER